MYRALKPIYAPLFGEWFRVEWQTLGIVDSMEEAKRKFGGSPVLEAIR